MRSLQQEIEALAGRFGIAALYAFGSRGREIGARVQGRGAAAEVTSDLDLAVQPARGSLATAQERVLLTQALESLFEVPRVDLVVLPEASTFLAADAVRGELLYTNDPDQQARDELYYLRRAGDLAPLQRRRLAAILEGDLLR